MNKAFTSASDLVSISNGVHLNSLHKEAAKWKIWIFIDNIEAKNTTAACKHVSQHCYCSERIKEIIYLRIWTFSIFHFYEGLMEMCENFVNIKQKKW